jgi:hypothetical protein
MAVAALIGMCHDSSIAVPGNITNKLCTTVQISSVYTLQYECMKLKNMESA